jgi:hypothetical protein
MGLMLREGGCGVAVKTIFINGEHNNRFLVLGQRQRHLEMLMIGCFEGHILDVTL